MLFSNCLATSSIVVRREILAGERFDAALNPVEDYAMWCRLLDRGRAECLPQPLVRYRVHGASLLHTHGPEAERGVRQIVTARLKRMAIAASSSELDIHRRIATGSLEATPAAVAAAEDWLAKLDGANMTTGRYPVDAFRRVLGRRWLEVCHLAVHSASAAACARVLRSRLTPRLLADEEGRRGLAGLTWRAARGAARRAWR
jgi:hypothetical protein